MERNRVNFTVNGKKCSVGEEISSDVMLVDYLREYLELRGTKYMCREGGCGACIVMVSKADWEPVITVNSCLVAVTSCDGWTITTIEDVGNRLKGYSTVQKTLADYNGSQCGYCSPAWVMSMTSLLKNHGSSLRMADIENSFASNICRCTGYRPILDAFKTFAKDAPVHKQIIDIEDANKICKKAGQKCKKDSCGSDWCLLNKANETNESFLKILLKDNKVWYKVAEIYEIFDVLTNNQGKSYMLVAGNTAKGAYPIEEYPDVLIDISGVESLKSYYLDQNLVLGAGNTLEEVISMFKYVSNQDHDGFDYLNIFADHLDMVAHPAVRNIGTIGGNLMLKHNHPEFQSDIFLLLESVGSWITIKSKSGEEQMPLIKFLKTDMRNKIIVNLKMPPLGSNYRIATYKITPRAQNSIAIVNASFVYKLDTNTETVQEASIVYGNLGAGFVHASKTEQYLVGKHLFSNETIQGGVSILNDELLFVGTAEAKQRIALGLFYKGILALCPEDKIDARFKSGAINLKKSRPVSKGKQVFDTDPSLWPLNQPIPKLEALIQCAGEAPYVDDTPKMPNELFVEFVLSTVAVAEIDTMDATAALALDGVVAFLSAKDIPGLNSFTPTNIPFNTANEELFCNGQVKFYDQPIGVIVAVSRSIARKATKLVKITYKNVKSPVIYIKDAKNDPDRVKVASSFSAETKGNNTEKVIKGSNSTISQYQFHMEAQTCVTRPTDDGIEVLPASQWLDIVQVAIQQALKLDENAINLSIRRLGGAFGGKISRSNQVAVANSLASTKLNVPCRMVLPLPTNMRIFGKRFPCYSEFEAGVDTSGKIQYLNYDIYEDDGYILNEPIVTMGADAVQSSYDKSTWNFNCYDVLTDTASNSWMRAPSTFEMIAMTEFMMEQIAYDLSLDPVQVRMVNLGDDDSMKDVIDTLIKDSDYDNRKNDIQEFNNNNQWKKKGLGFVPLKWPLPMFVYAHASVVIYHGDGSIVVSHSGIEMGQGINTKAAQVCAYTLGVPLTKVKVKAVDSINGANGTQTGGSYASESNCYAVIRACEILNQRLAPTKTSLGSSASWEDIIAEAYNQNVDLFGSFTATDEKSGYDVYGATLAEVEIDILTGEIEVGRVDLLEDTGQSLSPEVDIGQIEGSWVMGQGFWTMEDLTYDSKTGKLLTDRSWNYHVPQIKDIPTDLRIYFRRNSYNTPGVLGSKATGEPAMCMTVSVALAIRAALASARVDAGLSSLAWFPIEGTHSLEKIVVAAETKTDQFLISK